MNSPKNPETKKPSKKNQTKSEKETPKPSPAKKKKQQMLKKTIAKRRKPNKTSQYQKITRPLAKNSPFPRKWCKDNTIYQ